MRRRLAKRKTPAGRFFPRISTVTVLVLAALLLVLFTLRSYYGTNREAPHIGTTWHGVVDGLRSRPHSELDIHVVFSTDCSPYQNYQSILLFNSAKVVEQGRVTRIASGCTEEEKQELRSFMSRQPKRFRVHFTPDFSLDPETQERYPFYNKPNGMAHFLRYADTPVGEAVVALVDPDMVLMSRLSPYVGAEEQILWNNEDGKHGPEWVEEGYPVAQFYGLGGMWTKWEDLENITRELGPSTPATKISTMQAASWYQVGPPYMMHPRDWTRIIDLWVQMCPKVYARHPSILAEMYGFCIAAAHLRMIPRVARGLMVSDAAMHIAEGWDLIAPLEDGVCDPYVVEAYEHTLPPVMHYCQMYRVGIYMFGKRHPSLHTFFSCSSDSLEEPPPDLLSTGAALVRVHPTKIQAVEAPLGRRQGYAMCAVLRSLNRAQKAYKEQYCRPEEISGGVKRLTDLSQEWMKKAEAEITAMTSDEVPHPEDGNPTP